VTAARVGETTVFPLDSLTRLRLDRDLEVCVARTSSGDFYAVEDSCSHENARLSEGSLVGTEIECPLHGSRFDLTSGNPLCLPADCPIRTFQVVIENGDVFVIADIRESVSCEMTNEQASNS
jgi:3-phenylpropionate/trans-cinnamate dioxygenase ferredoxin component